MNDWKADAMRWLETVSCSDNKRGAIAHTDVGEMKISIIFEATQLSVYITSMRFIHNLSANQKLSAKAIHR